LSIPFSPAVNPSKCGFPFCQSASRAPLLLRVKPHISLTRVAARFLYHFVRAEPPPFSLDFNTTTRSDQVHQPPPPTNPNKSPRAPSYPCATPPFVQESINSANVVNLPPTLKFSPYTTRNRKSSCLPSWRKFLTPSTTLLPLLATPAFPTSLPTLPTLRRMTPSWPAQLRVADSTSETSRTRRPRGS